MFMSYLSVNCVYVLSIGDLKDKTYMNMFWEFWKHCSYYFFVLSLLFISYLSLNERKWGVFIHSELCGIFEVFFFLFFFFKYLQMFLLCNKFFIVTSNAIFFHDIFQACHVLLLIWFWYFIFNFVENNRIGFW